MLVSLSVLFGFAGLALPASPARFFDVVVRGVFGRVLVALTAFLWQGPCGATNRGATPDAPVQVLGVRDGL